MGCTLVSGAGRDYGDLRKVADPHTKTHFAPLAILASAATSLLYSYKRTFDAWGALTSIQVLTSLQIKNFKSLEDVEIELGKSVVFVGPNNSGKTTALQALALWGIGLRKWLEKRGATDTPEKRPGVTINRRGSDRDSRAKCQSTLERPPYQGE